MDLDTLATLIILASILIGLYWIINRTERKYKNYKKKNPFTKKEKNGDLPSIPELFSNFPDHLESFLNRINDNTYCKNCDSRISKTALFCSNCGEEIDPIDFSQEDEWIDSNEENSIQEKNRERNENLFTQGIGDYTKKDLEEMSDEGIYELIKSELQKITTSKRKALSGEVEYLKSIMKKPR